ncbi:hypothetical protein SMC26_14395 [Actinomadura fulvescens]|uniref:Thiaminase-2/PQQC domain-containing protein n=1 Tax=Actinomadura fulvescens TaxID=46160 RepID=A0ABP6CFA0_9ACTN
MIEETFKVNSAAGIAEQLVARRRTAPIGNGLVEHLKAGRPTREDLCWLLRIETLAAEAELSAYGIALYRHRHAIFTDLSAMVHSARAKLPALARIIGLSEEQRMHRPWQATAFSYPAYLCWTALHHSRAETGIAVYADLDRYYSGGLAVAEELRAAGGYAPDELIEYYTDGVPEDLCTKALDFAQDGLDGGDDPGQALAAGRVMEEKVGLYWQAAVPPSSVDQAAGEAGP